jgi:hypothetical protein
MRLAPFAELYSAWRSFLNMDTDASIVASVEIIHRISKVFELPNFSGVFLVPMA